jgi:hypothetical protein
VRSMAWITTCGKIFSGLRVTLYGTAIGYRGHLKTFATAK